MTTPPQLPPVSASDAGALTPGARPTFDLFCVWKEYEGVAMHFNDLLLRIRSQSLAAVAAFATVAGVLLQSEAIDQRFRWGALTAVFVALGVFWIAIWVLDFTYYNLLLIGAVRALTSVEALSSKGEALTEITLSTEIERAVVQGSKERVSVAIGRWSFYVLVFMVLGTGAAISTRQYLNVEKGGAQPAGEQPADSATDSATRTPPGSPAAAPADSPAGSPPVAAGSS